MNPKLPPKKIQLDRYDALRITWRDDTQSVYPVRYLRQKCPCASCREFRSQQSDPFRVLSDKMLATDVHVVKMEPVGHYALGFQFSDGHATGIYSYDFLLDIIPPTENPSTDAASER